MTLSQSSQKLIEYPQALCNMIRRIAVRAGDYTLQYYDESGSQADIKSDGSPVTIADREAEDIIIKALHDIMPDIPAVGEESSEAGRIPDLAGCEWFWLVDPLDGTREFIKGSGDYTVNIALIHRNIPVIGVVYAPVYGEVYAGCGPETAVRWKVDDNREKPIRVRDCPAEGLTICVSESHGDMARQEKFFSGFKVAKTMKRGSSLKICMIATGKADLYPRFGPTCEWDTAAADAVLRSAGGTIVDTDGNILTYGHADRKFLNPEFIASSGFWPFPEDS